MLQEDKYPDTFADVTLEEDGSIRFVDAKGRLHNPYGAALELTNGSKLYAIHGKYITFTGSMSLMRIMQLGKQIYHAMFRDPALRPDPIHAYMRSKTKAELEVNNSNNDEA